MSRLDDLFGKKIVRFDDEDENNRRQDETSASDGPPRSSLPPPVIAPQHQDRRTDWQAAPPSAAPGDDDDPTGKWHRGLPDEIQRMYAVAVQEKAYTLEEMHRLAQALCGVEWDRQSRAGKHPELRLPSQTADLIIRSVENRLRSAQVSQEPDLVENYQRVSAELSQAKGEMDGLRQRLHSAETAVREMKEAALKEAMRRQQNAESRAQTAFAKQRASSPPPAPRAPVAAPPVVAVEDYSDEDGDGDDKAAPEKRNERRDDVVCVIAATGLCRGKDVREELAKKWKVKNDNARRHVFRAAAEGLLNVKEIDLEWGGKPKGNIFVLTAQGHALAKSLGMQPVKGQYERGMALHKSEEHLYLILEIADILIANGYRDVDPFPPSVTLRGGNQQYQPDIRARMPSPNDTVILIEAERDTYKAADRADRSGKWLRAAEAGRGMIYLITPNNEAMATIVAEIDAVRKQKPQQKIQVKAFSVSDFRPQKGAPGTGIVWESKIESGVAK